MTAPLKQEITRKEFSVQKRELAYQFALDSFPVKGQDALSEPLSLRDESTVGLRRQAANLRNAKLKLDREKRQLESLQNELTEERKKRTAVSSAKRSSAPFFLMDGGRWPTPKNEGSPDAPRAEG